LKEKGRFGRGAKRIEDKNNRTNTNTITITINLDTNRKPKIMNPLKMKRNSDSNKKFNQQSLQLLIINHLK
jgi:hypothetical protein